MLSALTSTGATARSTAAVPVPVADLVPPPDGYQSPDWLR